ncbi:hypothetical protein BABINDRAFT_161429 [Babjeviella inositovora NRRL Y-12698]|uniref:Uncharacterized protein n=1 Tax=Babjeviella inositovora NRRL Y-12698 TaxID=984486 RepID=A0A1E3QPT6_9ASCO|nr:uncharacterized protein BABINDRAFT_161429 [Babjeviella inositovora NRRL Y-12698]ODQ79719.1 hypothetical protein BABINDRAFT_161429 [Babjeviella inositovora NRRL Y-12698]
MSKLDFVAPMESNHNVEWGICRVPLWEAVKERLCRFTLGFVLKCEDHQNVCTTAYPILVCMQDVRVGRLLWSTQGSPSG